MEITTTFEPESRAALRDWLVKHHAAAKEIWIVAPSGRKEVVSVSYLDVVEEALCFGWIDGIAKRFDAARTAQRLTPRRPKGNWTELNKWRARRLIAAGLMTDAGRAVLPDLLPAPIVLARDVALALGGDPAVRRAFDALPERYRRVRLGWIEEARKDPAERAKRLANLVEKTKAGQLYGNWDDRDLPRTGPPLPDVE